MKVYTKTGDKGTTALLGGTRVPKNHLKIEAYGTIDELNSWLGKVRSELQHFVAGSTASSDTMASASGSSHSASWQASVLQNLKRIQAELFLLGSHIACVSDEHRKKFQLADFSTDLITALEQDIDLMDQTLPTLKNFILPGGHVAAASTHVARTVCRRAERLIFGLEEHDPVWLAYINRLSDYCFVLARYINFQSQMTETLWGAD